MCNRLVEENRLLRDMLHIVIVDISLATVAELVDLLRARKEEREPWALH